MSKFEKILLLTNVFIYIFLTIFSYAYVDLNLTISKNPLIVNFVSFMQQLGYFNRLTATTIYLFFLIIAFSFYVFNLRFFFLKKIGPFYLKISTITNTLILIFAYPFLSADLFNYLFDAKIILNYHANPYTHRPLDFPNDEWLRFMRWVHRYSPYGPLWLLMSLIPSSLAFGKFILNIFFFKLFIAFYHLLNSYLIYKILKKINPKKVLFGTALYALCPLFLIEGVANAHNDIVLTTFLLGSIYYLVYKRPTFSYLSLFLGSLLKYIPILNLPWLVLALLFGKFKNSEKIKKDRAKLLIFANLATMAVLTYIFSSFRITVPFVSSGATQVQFQPWYLFWTLPYVAIIPQVWLITLSIAFSIGASLRYLPFLYYGDWSHSGTINFMLTVTIIPVILTIIILVLNKYPRNDKKT